MLLAKTAEHETAQCRRVVAEAKLHKAVNFDAVGSSFPQGLNARIAFMLASSTSLDYGMRHLVAGGRSGGFIPLPADIDGKFSRPK